MASPFHVVAGIRRLSPDDNSTFEGRVPSPQLLIEEPIPPEALWERSPYRAPLEAVQVSQAAFDELARSLPDPIPPVLAQRWDNSPSGLPLFHQVRDQQPRRSLDEAEWVASNWLRQPAAGAFLCGRPEDLIRRRVLRRAGAIQTGLELGGDVLPRGHVYWQQWHRNLPVYGAMVSAHLTLDGADRGFTLSSSYLPIPPDRTFEQRVDVEEARLTAHLALAAMLNDPAAISLLLALVELPEFQKAADERAWTQVAESLRWNIRRALEVEFPFPMRSDPAALQPALAEALKILEELGAGPDGVLQVAALLHATGVQLPGWESMPIPATGSFRCFWDESDELPWYMAQLPAHDDPGGQPINELTFIIAFGSTLHLAYRIDFYIPATTTRWSLFVDATRNTLLGEPQSLAFGLTATVFKDSQQAATNVAGEAVSLSTNPADYPWLHQFVDGDGFTVPLTDLGITTQPEATLANIAYHATQYWKAHPLSIQTSMRQGGKRLLVGVAMREISTEFTPFPERKEGVIKLCGTLILSNDNGRPIYPTANDPEIIIHEFTHGFTWLLYPALFTPHPEVAFRRPLIEGHANYQAHSFCPAQPDPDERFGRGSYRAEWGSDWALARSELATDMPDADLLATPDIFPPVPAAGLNLYYVGMIMARSLWDLRCLLGRPTTDSLALDSLAGIHGQFATFGTFASHLIALVESQMGGQAGRVLDQLLAHRGIVAARNAGILAMPPAETHLPPHRQTMVALRVGDTALEVNATVPGVEVSIFQPGRPPTPIAIAGNRFTWAAGAAGVFLCLKNTVAQNRHYTLTPGPAETILTILP